MVAIIVMAGVLLYGKLKGRFIKKARKDAMPKIKVDGDNIKVRFLIDDGITVFNYDTKNKKITVKGKEKDVANGIKAILAADDTVYFAVEETGKLYQLKNEKINDVFAKDEFDEDDDDWD